MANDFDFKFYDRFDEAKAERGVEHAIYDNVGNYYGTFTTILFDEFSKPFQVAKDRFIRVNKDKHNDEDTAENADVFAFVDICLLGWSGVKNGKGKEVPFSKEAAVVLLSHEKSAWLKAQLLSRSANNLLYQADPVATQDEVAGE